MQDPQWVSGNRLDRWQTLLRAAVGLALGALGNLLALIDDVLRSVFGATVLHGLVAVGGAVGTECALAARRRH